MSGGLSFAQVAEGYKDRYILATIGGTTSAITVEAGAAGRSFALGGEVSFVGAVTALQRGSTYSFGSRPQTWVSGERRHSDVLLSGLLHVASIHRMLDPFVGVTFGFGQDRYTNQAVLEQPSFPLGAPPVRRVFPDSSHRRDYLGVTAGLNLLRPVGKSLQLGGSVRWAWFGRERTNRDDGPSSGLGASLFTLGGVVRFK